jgi:hypothetical protein
MVLSTAVMAVLMASAAGEGWVARKSDWWCWKQLAADVTCCESVSGK